MARNLESCDAGVTAGLISRESKSHLSYQSEFQIRVASCRYQQLQWLALELQYLRSLFGQF
jgi:hypothetical protein